MPELNVLFGEKSVEIDGVIYKLKRLSHGEATQTFKGLTSFDPVSGQINVDADALALKRLVSSIGDWNLTKDGKKLEINEDTVKLIPEDHANRLLEFARVRASVRPELEKK